jgi:hypothetical protein
MVPVMFALLREPCQWAGKGYGRCAHPHAVSRNTDDHQVSRRPAVGSVRSWARVCRSSCLKQGMQLIVFPVHIEFRNMEACGTIELRI